MPTARNEMTSVPRVWPVDTEPMFSKEKIPAFSGTETWGENSQLTGRGGSQRKSAQSSWKGLSFEFNLENSEERSLTFKSWVIEHLKFGPPGRLNYCKNTCGFQKLYLHMLWCGVQSPSEAVGNWGDTGDAGGKISPFSRLQQSVKEVPPGTRQDSTGTTYTKHVKLKG